MYTSLGELTKDQALEQGKNLTAEQKHALAVRAVSLLPHCYGMRTDNCVKEQGALPSLPHCDEIIRGYVGDWDGMNRYIDQMPNCDEQSVALPVAIGVATVSLLAGFLLGRLSK